MWECVCVAVCKLRVISAIIAKSFSSVVAHCMHARALCSHGDLAPKQQPTAQSSLPPSLNREVEHLRTTEQKISVRWLTWYLHKIFEWFPQCKCQEAEGCWTRVAGAPMVWAFDWKVMTSTLRCWGRAGDYSKLFSTSLQICRVILSCVPVPSITIKLSDFDDSHFMKILYCI